MTLDAAVSLCTAAGLNVLGAAVVGSQVCVVVSPPSVSVETLAKRLGTPFTVGFGDGTTSPQLWFSAGAGT